MLIYCKQCHREYVVSKVQKSEQLLCAHCRGCTKLPGNSRLGLHPALEQKILNNSIERQRTRVGNHIRKSDDIRDISGMPDIPGFEIAFQIGRGAMGSVYRARQVKTGNLVAIKVLSQELSQRSDLVARFEREAYALKSLTHENVVAIIDAGSVANTHFFAMEFIKGITLRTQLNQGSLDLDTTLIITQQILRGLMAAHERGIIHRDLKPENVLLEYHESLFHGRPDRVVLVDFGLVGIAGVQFDPHPNLTRSKVTMGTVNYMAPEQHMDAKRVDGRSDLYSAGVILYEMITGDLPLGRYQMPKERGLEVPEELETILSKALARDVLERYPDAQQFLADIGQLMHTNLTKKPDTPIEISPKKVSDNYLESIFKSFSKSRYVLLFLLAALFFGVGIKLSL